MYILLYNTCNVLATISITTIVPCNCHKGSGRQEKIVCMDRCTSCMHLLSELDELIPENMFHIFIIFLPPPNPPSLLEAPPTDVSGL